MGVVQADGGVLAVEVFSTKDAAGVEGRWMMAVPCRCGLKQADALRIDGLSMLAVRGAVVLPIDLPLLSERCRAGFLALAEAGKPLAVGEFMAAGMLDSYSLDLVFVGGA